MISRRAFGIAAAALCLGFDAANPVRAQSYPAKPIRIIVPAAPGGPTDVLARLAAHHLQAAIGQSVIIENLAGGGGVIAAKAAARAAPDGYTLLLANTSLLAVIPAISKSPGYDPVADFAPVAKIGDAFQILVSHPTFPSNSVQELVAYAKANPGKLNYSSGGYGTLPHLAGELLKSIAGIDAVHVPYKSDAEVVSAILGNQVHVSFVNVAVALPLVKEGKLKALAVTSAARAAELPEVPTMRESGVTDYVVTSFFGVVAPAGTPAEIVGALNGAINGVLKSGEMRASLAKLGVQASPGTAEGFAAFIAGEAQKWLSGHDGGRNQSGLREATMSISETIARPASTVAAPVGPERIAELALAFRAAKVLFSAVELGLFTALAGTSGDLDTLRVKIGIAERGAQDFFDALVALGLLERDRAGLYRNTPEADQYLDADKSTYIGDELNHLNVRMYPHWQRPDGGPEDGNATSRCRRERIFQHSVWR